MIRILCTADLHLGRSSSGQFLNGIDVSAASAWDRIIDLAITERAHAVVMAGDIFDSSAAYHETRKRFLDGVQRLATQGIPTIAVAGNHDWDATKRLSLSTDLVKVLGLRGWEEHILTLGGQEIRFVGWSFRSSLQPNSPLESSAIASSAIPTVGLLHCDLDPNSRYAPVTKAQLGSAPVQAWVLGHIHRPANFVCDSIPCCYPSSPQALDFGPGEVGVHGITWLEIGDQQVKFSEVHPISTVRFEYLEELLSLEAGSDPVEELHLKLRAKAHNMSVGPVATVQLRVNLKTRGITKGTFLADPISQNLDPHTFTICSVTQIPSKNLWDYAQSPDAAGQVARIILGLKHLNGEDVVSKPEPVWIKRAEALVESAALSITRTTSNYFAGFESLDENQERLLRPASDNLDDARTILIEEAESILSQLEEQRA